MLNSWLDFISSIGGNVDSNRASHFSTIEKDAQACLTNTSICDLSHLDLLAVEGEEAKSFLQGQLSCDLEAMNSHSMLSGAYCTPKGRMVSSFRLFNIGDTCYLLMEPGLSQATEEVLGKYIIFSKAEIKDARNDFITFGLSGSKAEKLLADLCPVPEKTNSTTRNDNIICARLDDVVIPEKHEPIPRFIIFCPQEDAQAFWQNSGKEAIPVGQNAWHLLDILSGYGQVEKSTVEQFLPHHLNYQHTGAVSFNKGCYTGQEIVARMQYRGKLKSRLFLAEVEVKDLPEPGTEIFVKAGDELKHHGELINIAVNGKKTDKFSCKILALLPSNNTEQTPIYLSDSVVEPVPIKILELPYEVVE